MKEKEKESTKKYSFFKSLKNVIFEFIDTRTDRNIPISQENKIILQLSYLLIAACFFLVSSAYCSYSLWTSLHKYFQYDTVTSIKILQEVPTMFPAITFCSLKQSNKTFADKNDQDKKEILKNMIMQCEINWQDCSYEDFKYFFDPQFGDCFTFNNEDVIVQTTLPGPDYGLCLDLFLGNPKMHLESGNKIGEMIGDGIVIVVHNQSNLPFLNNDRILAATGGQTDLKINRNFISKLGLPYSDCVKNNNNLKSEFYDYIVNTLKLAYSQQHCYSICLQKEIFDECGCSISWFHKYENSSFCGSEKNECLAYITKITVNKLLHEKLNTYCLRKCPLECDNVQYKISTSRSLYPSPYLRDLIYEYSIVNKSGILKEDIDKAVVRINVFYESTTYMTTTETESMTAIVLFSNIGGTFSLCLGISILSLIKIVGILVSISMKNKANNKIDQW